MLGLVLPTQHHCYRAWGAVAELANTGQRKVGGLLADHTAAAADHTVAAADHTAAAGDHTAAAAVAAAAAAAVAAAAAGMPGLVIAGIPYF